LDIGRSKSELSADYKKGAGFKLTTAYVTKEKSVISPEDQV